MSHSNFTKTALWYAANELLAALDGRSSLSVEQCVEGLEKLLKDPANEPVAFVGDVRERLAQWLADAASLADVASPRVAATLVLASIEQKDPALFFALKQVQEKSAAASAQHSPQLDADRERSIFRPAFRIPGGDLRAFLRNWFLTVAESAREVDNATPESLADDAIARIETEAPDLFHLPHLDSVVSRSAETDHGIDPAWKEYRDAVFALEDAALKKAPSILGLVHDVPEVLAARGRLYAAVCELIQRYTKQAKSTSSGEIPARRIRGIYVASRSRHASMWLRFRAKGYPILSTWIDEAGPGETLDWMDLWRRCVRESHEADVLILYAESGEVLRGALVEMGSALAGGRVVICVCPDEVLGNLVRADILRAPTVESAFEMAMKILNEGSSANEQ